MSYVVKIIKQDKENVSHSGKGIMATVKALGKPTDNIKVARSLFQKVVDHPRDKDIIEALIVDDSTGDVIKRCIVRKP